ncbi:glycine-rich protein [Striga asiatica]|uniref:Glycine-rich protein n=1 Tax=Striga asiatica TaxID=4170 RepID=A0A5A7P0G3_STRAF|nr:glycine-rich protein [Striga asiatica]
MSEGKPLLAPSAANDVISFEFAVKDLQFSLQKHKFKGSQPYNKTEELDWNKLGDGFRSYGVGIKDEQPRRQGGINREGDREFAPSRANETDNWAGFGEQRKRGEQRGFFTNSQLRTEFFNNWASKKSSMLSEPRRLEKRVECGLESGNSCSELENWLKRNKEERPRPGGSFNSLRKKRVGGGKEMRREVFPIRIPIVGGRKEMSQSVGSGRAKLNLQSRTLPVGKGQQEEVADVVKPMSSKAEGGGVEGEGARLSTEVMIGSRLAWASLGCLSPRKWDFIRLYFLMCDDLLCGQPKLNLQPRTFLVADGQKEEVADTVKLKSSNSFGGAWPREKVLC